MKTNYFFLLFFLLILMGCSDDKNIPDIPASTEDTYEGVHDLISFTKETEDFTYGDLTFHIKTPDGNIIQRKAKHRRLSGTSLFTMEKGLKRRVNTSYYIWNIPSNRIARTLTGGMGSSAWGATLPSVRMGSPPKPTVTSESACMGTVRRKIRTG